MPDATLTAPGGAPLLEDDASRRLLRLAVACLIGHAALTCFSAYAFSSFLFGPPPAWLQTPTNQEILKLGFRFGGPTCVVLGALAGAFHAAGRLGRRTALTIFALAFTISLGAELTGTSTGYPFGAYSYTTQLGYRIGGLVPFNIPTSWFYMLYCSLAIVGRLARPDDRSAARWRWAILAALVLTAWDVSMDPAMVRTTHWLWHLQPDAQLTPFRRAFSGDLFYGMPLTNWLGWLLTGTIVARVMLAVVPPTTWTARVSPSRFPLVLYGVNGILPIAICIRQGMTWAAVLGAAAMLVPLALAAARDPRAVRGRASTAAGGEPAGDRAMARDARPVALS